MQIRLYRNPVDQTSQRLQPGDSLNIDDPVTLAEAQPPVYRRLIYLQIPRDGIATALRLNDATLDVRFRPQTLLTGMNSPLLAEPWEFEDGKVRVHLQKPWHVHAIHTAQSALIDFFRVDGDAIADEATVSAYSGQAVNPEFVSPHFAMSIAVLSHLFPGKAQKQASPSGTDTLMASGNGGTVSAKATGQSGSGHVKTAVETASVAFHGVQSVSLHSYPTTPSVWIPAQLPTDLNALQNDPETVPLELLWQEAGERRDDTAAAIGESLDAVLLPKLRDLLQQTPASTEPLWVPLILQSDAPCRWQLDAMDLSGHYLIDRFHDDKQHKVSFDSHQIQDAILPLSLPTGSITTASLKIDISNKGHTAPGSDAGTSPGNAQRGVSLGAQTWAAARIVPPAAGYYDAVMLALSPLSAHSHWQLDLITDDSPQGKPIASATLNLTRTRANHWATLRFGSTRLDAAPCWLRLTALEGSGVWIGDNAPDSSVQTGKVTDSSALPARLTGIQPRATFLAESTSPAPNPPLFTLLADETPVPLTAEGAVFTITTPSLLDGKTSLRLRQNCPGGLTLSQVEIGYLGD